MECLRLAAALTFLASIAAATTAPVATPRATGEVTGGPAIGRDAAPPATPARVPGAAPAPAQATAASGPPAAGSEGPDLAGPTIEPRLPAAVPAGAPLPLAVIARDPSGVAAVWVRYRTRLEDGFQTIHLSPRKGDEYAVVLPTEATPGAFLDYVLSARDTKGNVSQVGSPAQPLHLDLSPVKETDSGELKVVGTQGKCVGIAGLLALWLLLRSTRRGKRAPVTRLAPHASRPSAERASPSPASAASLDAEEAFWRRLLWPLLSLSPDEVIDELRQRSLSNLNHPRLGMTRVHVPELIARFNDLRRSQGQPPLFVGKGAPAGPAAAPGRSPRESRKSKADRAAAAPATASAMPATSAASSTSATSSAGVSAITEEITEAFGRLRVDHRFDDPVRAAAEVGTELGVHVQVARDGDPDPNPPKSKREKVSAGR